MLRPARAADLEILVGHRRRMWADMGRLAAGASDSSEAPYREWLRPRLASGEVVGWVAETAGAATASGLLWFQPWHPRPQIPRGTIPYLLSVFVEPSARRHGLARAITEAAIASARAAGHPRIALHASDAGRPLYARMGFLSTNEMGLDLPVAHDGKATQRL